MDFIIFMLVALALLVLTWVICFFAGLSSRWSYPHLRYAVLAPIAGFLAWLITGLFWANTETIGLLVYALLISYGFSGRVDIHAQIEQETAEALALAKAEAERVARANQEALEAHFSRFKALEEIMEMHPSDFEIFVGELFRKSGYESTVTSYVADEGVDLIVQKGGRRSVVQCKRVSGAVGQTVVRDVYGTMLHCKAREAYIVTTGRFTLPATQWARGKPIHLVDGSELVEWIQTLQETESLDQDGQDFQEKNVGSREALEAITVALQRIMTEGKPRGHNFVIFSLADPRYPYYVQFAASAGDTELHGEAASGECLGAGAELTDSQVARLLSMGWQSPVYESEAYPGNYHRTWSADDYSAVARLVVHSFIEGYGVPSSAILLTQIHVDQL